jgi:hypothetical protein
MGEGEKLAAAEVLPVRKIRRGNLKHFGQMP